MLRRDLWRRIRRLTEGALSSEFDTTGGEACLVFVLVGTSTGNSGVTF